MARKRQSRDRRYEDDRRYRRNDRYDEYEDDRYYDEYGDDRYYDEYEDDRYYDGYDDDPYYDDYEDDRYDRARYREARYEEDMRRDSRYERDRAYYEDDTPADYIGPAKRVDKGRSASPERKRRRGNPFRNCLIVVFLLLAILCGGAYALVKLGLNGMSRLSPVSGTTETGAETTGSGGTAVSGDPKVTNILLVGQDARTGEEQTRTDTMILCSINTRSNRITMVSLMRDMYVPIPGYGSDRLNAAHVYGGLELLDQTIQEDFNVAIDGNALVDLDGFLAAMTSVGDLEIELTQEEADYLNYNRVIGFADDQTDEVWNLTAGVNTMTPNQVLAYCRMREVGNSDWDRTERQRKVLMLAFDKLKHSDPLTQMRVLQDAAPSIATDLSEGTFLKTILTGMLSGGNDIQTYLLPAEGTYSSESIDGMAVLVPDLEANAALLHQYLYE